MEGEQHNERETQQAILDAVTALKAQIQSLEVPKRKDFWDRFSIVSSFLGSVLLASVGFWFTHSYQKQEVAARTARESEQQRRDEIELATKLIPLLTSDDEQQRHLAREALRSAQRQPKSPDEVTQPDANNVITKRQLADLSLDKFISIALADTEPDKNRTAATRKIADIARDGRAPQAVRERATNAVSQIAISENAPAEAKELAADVLSDLRLVTAEQAIAAITQQKISRKINEVMLHHSKQPSIGEFQGEKTVLQMARFAINFNGWAHAPWNFLITPNGRIWIGRPLEMPSMNTPGHNENGVNVTLILDGDIEQPTVQQQRAAGILLRGLLAKFKLRAEDNFGPNSGFHSDYSEKSCPGKFVTKPAVLGWIAANNPMNAPENSISFDSGRP